MNILELANASGVLEEKMSEEKLVKKILRSLTKRFNMKVTAIEEAQDIKNMKVEELIGSLQTFEMAISDHIEERKKDIAFLSNMC
jgi:excinuclease UvrABC nuclease subunit